MTTESVPAVTIEECLAWAKDRLIDDIKFGLLQDQYETNYAAKPSEEKEEFDRACAKFGRLMGLRPSMESLKQMEEAGYWNGLKDTYFEQRPVPLWLEDPGVYHYVPEQYRQEFVSPFDQHADRIGQKFTVLRVIPAEEATPDYDTPEAMYRIRFEDGFETDAWGEEVCVPEESTFMPPWVNPTRRRK